MKREIQDIEKMEGWAIYQSSIKEEIETEVENLRRIEVEGRTLQDVGAEYVRIVQKINGLSRALEIPEEIKEVDNSE